MSLSCQDINASEYEVIVVGDGYAPPPELTRYGPNIYLHRIDKTGVCCARNFGAQKATANLLLFLDDDVIAKYNCLRAYLNLFKEQPNLVAAGGTVIGYPSDNTISKYFTYRQYLGMPIFVSGKIHSLISASCCFRRSTFEQIGGFSPEYDIFKVGGEDLDISTKILKQNLEIGYCAKAVVWHHNRESLQAFIKQQYRNGFGIYMCAVLQGLEQESLGIVRSGSLYGCMLNMLNFVFVGNRELKSKSLLKRFSEYIRDKSLDKREAFLFSFYDLVRRISIVVGHYKSSRSFK